MCWNRAKQNNSYYFHTASVQYEPWLLCALSISKAAFPVLSSPLCCLHHLRTVEDHLPNSNVSSVLSQFNSSADILLLDLKTAPHDCVIMTQRMFGKQFKMQQWSQDRMEICETGHRDNRSEAENRDTKQKVFKMYLTSTSRFKGSFLFVKLQHFQAVKLTKYLKTNLLNGPKTFISSV